MNVILDKDIILELTKYISTKDKASSSHWDQFHQTYSFDGNSFKGLEGMEGHCQPQGNPLKQFLHYLFQAKYRNMGKAYSTYDNVYEKSKNVIARMNGQYDLAMIRQVLTVSLLSSQHGLCNNDTVVIIGDGFAALGSLLREVFPSINLIFVNLNKTLLIDYIYFKKVHPNSICYLAEKDSHLTPPKNGEAVFIRAENCHLIKELAPNWAINIASMQEMDMKIINNYFDILRSGNQALKFYCCNRISKTLPDGSVIAFESYPWQKNDVIHLDELTPWHQKYYGFSPPFYFDYDGKIKHRIATMALNK
ncbi:MAG: putative sugar O-methyltransferase [Bacteriovoracaceae bacterium]